MTADTPARNARKEWATIARSRRPIYTEADLAARIQAERERVREVCAEVCADEKRIADAMLQSLHDAKCRDTGAITHCCGASSAAKLSGVRIRALDLGPTDALAAAIAEAEARGMERAAEIAEQREDDGETNWAAWPDGVDIAAANAQLERERDEANRLTDAVELEREIVLGESIAAEKTRNKLAADLDAANAARLAAEGERDRVVVVARRLLAMAAGREYSVRIGWHLAEHLAWPPEAPTSVHLTLEEAREVLAALTPAPEAPNDGE